ncbi:MAG: DUF58 domain-containing protein [Clostridiales bacterium]|jgi:uncharacterized protein (DUF58 family)|nr:DUF58 domain-containing protein [Eubacteriales bacterium]MDH7567605.1 DUF58 domain-containing protein [Clostridiales bacterium]
MGVGGTMSELFDSEFLKKLQRLVINSRIVLSEGMGGNRKSRSKGSSVEFSDYREYAASDDFRRVDWNAYGRFEKLYIKLFMEEREAPVHVFLDTSKSMDWGEPNKSVASRRLAAVLSYISLSNYDTVSLTSIGSRMEESKASLRGKNSFKEVLDFLEKMEYGGPTDLYAAVRDSGLKSGRGISILISDLFSQGSLEDAVKYLQFRKQEVFLCHMLAPQEVNPEINASLRLVDIETGEYRDITATSRLVKAYKNVYHKFIASTEAMCRRRGVNYIKMETTMDLDQMIKMVVR